MYEKIPLDEDQEHEFKAVQLSQVPVDHLLDYVPVCSHLLIRILLLLPYSVINHLHLIIIRNIIYLLFSSLLLPLFLEIRQCIFEYARRYYLFWN